MAKYKVKHTTILHNKKAYAEDSVIELKEEDAVRLADFLDLIPEAPSTNNKQQIIIICGLKIHLLVVSS